MVREVRFHEFTLFWVGFPELLGILEDVLIRIFPIQTTSASWEGSFRIAVGADSVEVVRITEHGIQTVVISEEAQELVVSWVDVEVLYSAVILSESSDKSCFSEILQIALVPFPVNGLVVNSVIQG